VGIKMQNIKPPKLHANDVVAIISPSSTIANRKDVVEKARKNFEQYTGLKTILAPNAMAQHYYSGGTVQKRLDDFHWALQNQKVKAIIFSVGGDTAVELVDKLDYELIKQNPKIIAGISDGTTLLNPIYAKTGLITFVGLELLDFANNDMTYEVEQIKKAWFEGSIGNIQPNPNWKDFEGNPTSYKGWQTIRKGTAQGKLVGGNHTSFAQLLNTGYAPELTGNILVTEHYNQSKKQVHRALADLRLLGAFDKISALIMGYCLGSDNLDEAGNNRDMVDLVQEATESYNFPIMWMGEIGHRVENIMLPIGASASLDATNLKFKITERVAS
jgi:muramoyltetrapeptide carboxypeptidase